MKRRRMMAIAAVGLAVVAGGGAAVAATTGGERQRERAILNDAAGRLGVTPDRLREALGAAQDAQLDAAVRAGDLTQEQADAIKERRAESGLVLGGGRGGPEGHGRFGHHGFGFGFGGGAAFDAAAEALGLTGAQLRERFADGDTLAEIAQAENVPIAAVRAAVRAAVKAQLDEAVQDGDLTQAQADRLLEDAVDHLEDFPGRGFGGPGFGHHGGPGGPGFGGFALGAGGEVLDAAAEALGLTRDQLLNRLRDGDTLAEIAEAENTPIADVRAAARAAAKAELDEAVQDGDLTRAQADRLLEEITERIEDFPADRRFGGRRWGP